MPVSGTGGGLVPLQLLPWSVPEAADEKPRVRLLQYSPGNQETPRYRKLCPFLCRLVVNLSKENKNQSQSCAV